jgi:transposase
MPKKRSKKNPLTEEDKKNNRQLSSDRVLNENEIGNLKRFKITSDRYRNRRKRFSSRFNLIAGIYNLELVQRYSSTAMKRIEKQEAEVILSIAPLLRTFDKILEEVEKLDKEMLRLINQDKEEQLLMTIPGIGPVKEFTCLHTYFQPRILSRRRISRILLGPLPTFKI